MLHFDSWKQVIRVYVIKLKLSGECVPEIHCQLQSSSIEYFWGFKMSFLCVGPTCRHYMEKSLIKKSRAFYYEIYRFGRLSHVGRHTNKVNYVYHLETVVRLHSWPAGPVQHTGNESLWPSFAASKGPILYLCSQKIGFLEGFGSDVAVVCLRSWVELHTGDGGKALSA